MSARVMGSDAARAVGRFNPDGAEGYRAATAPNAPLRATRAEAVEDERVWLEDGLAPVRTWRKVCAPDGSGYAFIWHDGENRIVRPWGGGRGYVLISFGWSAPHRPEAAYNARADTLRELFDLADVPRCEHCEVTMTATSPGRFECPTSPEDWRCTREMTRNAAAGVETLAGWLSNA